MGLRRSIGRPNHASKVFRRIVHASSMHTTRVNPSRSLSRSAALSASTLRLSAGTPSWRVFYIGRGDQEWVLRRPPRGPLLPTAHDVLREHRVLKALNTTNVPTPRVLLACDDMSVIGAP
jgi:aminoglycoside phosphotransferase (APT) family kinase protein